MAERTRTQQVIEESERRYRTLFNLTPACTILEDEHGIILDVNDAVVRHFGYTREELLGAHVRMFMRPEDASGTDRNIARILGGATLEHEVANIRKDGSLCEMELRETMISLPGGQRGILVVATDVTEKKQAERALKQNEARLRQIIDLVPHFVFAKDADGKFILVNKAVAEAYGTTVEELIGKTDADFNASPEEVDHFRKDDLDVIVGGVPKVVDQELITDAKGKVRVLHTVKIPFSFSGSALPAVLGVSTDITDRIAMENAIRESEQLYRALVHQSSDPIWVLQGHHLVYVNPAWQEKFGYTIPEESDVAIDAMEVIAPESHHVVREFFADFRAGRGLPTRCEIRGKQRSGEIVDLDVSMALIEWKGKPAVQGILRDVTDQKRAEETIRQTQKMESLGVLAGGVAHDFNNLLQAILGHISLALQRISPANPAAENLVKAETAAERAAQLTHQLLAYSGSGKFNVKPLDLNSLIQESQGLFQVALRDTVVLVKELEPGLPAIDADASQIQQVMMNLIINATEAITGRSGRVLLKTETVALGVEETREWVRSDDPLNPDKYVLLEVTDNGSGMDHETIKKIFDPFFTTKFLGRGLGLSTVLGILKGHHAGYQVRSEIGKGTTFQLLFPISQRNVPVAKLGEDSFPNSEKSILVIDDEEEVLDVVFDMLGEAKIPAIVARSGEEGVAIYRERFSEIRLVLLDLSMPGIGGKETFIAMKQINPAARIVVSSGYSESEAVEELKGLGMAGFIQKPYRWHTLVEELQTLGEA